MPIRDNSTIYEGLLNYVKDNVDVNINETKMKKKVRGK